MLTSAILWSLIAAASGAPAGASLQAQVREAVLLADGMKIAVGEFVSKTNRMPASNEEAGLPAPTLIRGRYVASGAVSGSRISFEFGPGANSLLVSRHLFFEGIPKMEEGRVVSLMWICRSDDLAQEACPSSCDCTDASVQAQVE
jgi:type IV pilus assembly protein PilA